MREAIKYGLLALAAWWAYRQWSQTRAAVPEPASAPQQPPPPQTLTTEPVSKDVVNQIKIAAGRDRLNWDQWHYYYRQITGQSLPAPEEFGYTRDWNQGGAVAVNGKTQFTFEEWVALWA